MNVSGGYVSLSSRLGGTPRRRRTVIGIAVAIVAIGVVGFVGLRLTPGNRSTAGQPTAPPPPESLAIPGCYNPSVPPTERPRKLNIVGCASVAVGLRDMSWSTWGPQGADGTGTAVFKLCDPNCAAGYQITKPVVVHAWNAQPPRRDAICQLGLKIYNDMILAFPQGAPPPSTQPMDTQYNGMPAVHYVDYSPSNSGDTQFIGYTFCN